MSLYLAKATDSALKVGATWQMGTTSLDVHVLLGICSWSCLRGMPWGCLLIFVQEASLEKSVAGLDQAGLKADLWIQSQMSGGL